ncbi:hypothetical protein P3T39_006357 [Kitasatospora sp. GP82]|nr:hypothetical protein [Kitasatospora sp. GP82]
MIQRTWWEAQRRNSRRPMSRGLLSRPAACGLLRPEISLLSVGLCCAGFTRPRVAREGLIRSGSARLRVVRSMVPAAAASCGRLGAGVVMT